MHDHNALHRGHSRDHVAYAECEGELLAGLSRTEMGIVAEVCERKGVTVDTVFDVGSGPGVGSETLARRFPRAQVLAIDRSSPMRDRADERARRLGLQSRIRAVEAELPAGLADLGCADVIWASQVLHHLDDGIQGLAAFRSVLSPGGVVAIVEPTAPIRAVAGSTPAGVWDRLEAAWNAWSREMWARGRAPLEDTALFGRAGLEVVVDRMVVRDVEPPLGERDRDCAMGHLAGLRSTLAHHAAAVDLEALDDLLEQRPSEMRLTASHRLIIAHVGDDGVRASDGVA